ncbi:hypothetical protein BH09GEM1_BH09GEM1_44540 [soil metagenome]
MARLSRASRSSLNPTPIPTLEHDALAVRLQAELGTRVLLVRAIGEGGMGRVYLARDPQLRRFVAVKVLLHTPGAEGEAHARFQREAQAIAAVSHPNVVAIHGVGELPDGTPYFIMQHVAGGSMADRLATTGPLPIELAERVLGDVAAGLSAAHKRGIIHRDVKPANVLWDEEGERATVSDFGIAALQGPEGDESEMRITGSGMAVGSPTYMSPEQLLAEPVTPKSDIYALGLLGYELLTGNGPYVARAPSELVAAHLRHVPRRMSELRPEVPPDLEVLLLRCLAKDPADRPTADDVMLALKPGAADALEWPPPGLERARGALWRLILMPMVGSLLLLVPLLAIVTLDSAGFGDVSDAWSLLLAISSLAGFVAFARGGAHLWRLRAPLSQAARLGYGWGTLLEVIADRRGDTGSLIAGTREYAMLATDERAALRVLRVTQAGLLALAAPLALVAAVVSLAIRGSEHGGEGLLRASSIWTLLGLGGIGIACGVYERARLASIRHKRALRPRHTSEMELAPAWLAAFERSRAGQWFGSGVRVRRVVTVGGALAAGLLILISAGILLMVSTMTVSGRLITNLTFPGAYSWLAYQSQRHTGVELYRVPSHGSATPAEAGESLLILASTGRPRKPSPLEKRQSADYPVWRRVTPSPTLFPRPAELPWTSAAILVAGKGLNAEQRDVLTRAAAHPARDEFSRAALADSADIYGALLKLPLPRPLGPFEFPEVQMYPLNEAAESQAARAALDVADHRPADAERHAKEIISVGLLLLDSHLLQDNRTGQGMVALGVSTLEAVYVATGREREARVLLDSVVHASSHRERPPLRLTIGAFRGTMHNVNLSRGARMGALFPILLHSCADPKQLLFGVDDEFRKTVSYARDSLARFSSERVWVDGMSNWIAGADSTRAEPERTSVYVALAQMLDRVVGGRRFASCAALMSR